jgi:hypothetical protein
VLTPDSCTLKGGRLTALFPNEIGDKFTLNRNEVNLTTTNLSHFY